MTVSVIINSKSGEGEKSKDDLIPRILKEFQDRNITAQLHVVEGSDIPKVIAESISVGVDAIIIGGGDGTINTVVSKLAGSAIPIGILPLGTFNHFARDLGLPESLGECIDIIAQGQSQSIDIAEVNGKMFLNNSSIGVYALAVKLRENYRKKLGWTKRWAMVRAALNIFNRFPTFTVELETDSDRYFRKTSFVFIGNNKYTGGTREKLTEGVLSIYTAHLKGRWGVLLMGLLSVINKLGDKYFDLHLVTELELNTRKKKMIVAIDGEVMEMKPPLQYKIRPLQLRVLLPKISA